MRNSSSLLARKIGIYAVFLGLTAGILLVQASAPAPSYADHDPFESHDSLLSDHGEASHLDIYSAHPEELSHSDTFSEHGEASHSTIYSEHEELRISFVQFSKHRIHF